MSNLHIMYSDFGVSPWLDNLSRAMLDDGSLQAYVDNGILGVTSNPSIFEKAFSDKTQYQHDIEKLISGGASVEDTYWTLAIEDIQRACDILKPVYDESNGNDGFVSLEVHPNLATNTQDTIAQAKDLWSRVNRCNVMIKIPATIECIPAISEVIASGIHVNVTLIFSLHRYLQVIDAFMTGLEALPDPSVVRSVASFFVSRVDSAVDELLPVDSQLRGKVALAQAQAAYGIYLESFNPDAERWSNLLQRGAHAQRALWASTSTKNPEYDELLYISGLLSRNSVNTIPNATVDAIVDRAVFEDSKRITPETIQLAHETLSHVEASGIKMKDISEKLEIEGVKKFQEAFQSMLNSISS